MKVLGVPARVGGGWLNPASELDVTARWGIAGKGGVCMPSKGKAIERAYTPDELSALASAADCLGAKTFDVYLNDALPGSIAPPGSLRSRFAQPFVHPAQ